ncbi:Hypothetical predicted protein [Cloeon dipterum]|uniref:Odorant receptor n=1 Tax=Cloeon dipterum TaxID=197152 RepID=A0A8S1CHY7_9INSE|nr:Hypothetical predicted protein [Cloeon dipterum]
MVSFYKKDCRIPLDISRVFVVAKILLSPFGLWIDQPGIRFLVFLTTTVKITTFVLNFTCVLLTLANLYMETHELSDKTFIYLVLLRLTSVLQKIHAMDANKRLWRDILTDAFKMKKVPLQARNSFEELKKRLRVVPKFLFIIVVLILINVLPVFIFTSKKTSPIPILIPFRQSQYPFIHRIFFIFSSLSMLLNVITVLGFIAFYVSLATSCTLLIKHMNEVLSVLGDPPKVMTTKDYEPSLLAKNKKYNQRVRKILIYCHKLHLKIFNLSDTINLSFSNAVMVEMWAILMAQCTLAFIAAKIDLGEFFRFIALLQYIAAVTVLFSAICSHASESEKLVYSCRSSAWWTYNTENLAFVKLIGLRASEPICLKIGHFQPISIRTLKLTTEISFTYFMFLYSFK